QADPAAQELRAVAQGLLQGALDRPLAHPEPFRQVGPDPGADSRHQLVVDGVGEAPDRADGPFGQALGDAALAASTRSSAASAAATADIVSWRRRSSDGVTATGGSARREGVGSGTTASPAGRRRMRRPIRCLVSAGATPAGAPR